MLRALISLSLALLLAACETPPTAGNPAGEAVVRFGQITSIEAVTIEANQRLGLGAVAGAVVGGLLGNQIGGGTGRDIATVAGAVAGGFAGQQVQNRYAGQPGQRITLQMDTGEMVSITQPADANLRVGDRVRIDGAGEEARVRR
ncbi:glycine zipper 2TM domain-containing protein [Ramlibacter agri]|nr:glycine zipper 2TM domain-containing protein [Ramlibacter agri]